MRNQGRLAAEAEQHARDVKERNRFMRQIAAQSGVMQLPGMSLSILLRSDWRIEPPRKQGLAIVSLEHVKCTRKWSPAFWCTAVLCS